jgi:outer membrane receptor protein involved in Fe transport
VRRGFQKALPLGLSLLCLALPRSAALAQTALPEVQVKPMEPAALPHKAKPKRQVKATAASHPTSTRQAAPSAPVASVPITTGGAPAMAVPSYQSFDAVRANILPPTGTNATSMSQAAIAALPQGDDTPIEKTLLQTPGFSQDSAASGALHLRNDHANVQYRIDGVWLPDGVSGFSQMLDSGFIGTLNVIDGALPAEYGLHTTGVVDITPRSHAFDGGGSVGVFGGSQGTISPTFQYGGTAGRTEYYVVGRGFWTNEGIENTTSAYNAIHDSSDQEKFFAYAKTYLGDGSTITIISGASLGAYQIPNNPGQPIQFPVPGANPVPSSQINESQYEQSYYNVIAWQKSFPTFDVQLSAFSRYSSLHFIPDQIGDLEFNGVSSNVFRSSLLNGVQGDAAWRATTDHTLRFGFTGSGELAKADNTSVVFPVDGSGAVDGWPFVAPPQLDSRVGWLLGAYVQDEWRITKQLTLNTGVRFDQMYGYVDANQFSPRVNVSYKITPLTTFHVGYARYFTPPELSLSAPTNTTAFNGTTQQAAVPLDDPVRPERSNYFDVGVDQQLSQWLTAGVDAYYKKAADLIDDGQFGQANTLTAFNYAKGWNEGVEGKFRYDRDNFSFYGNLAWGHQYATQPNSNQFLWSDPTEYAYAMTHYIPTDHSQTWTGSAGASYLWYGTRYSADVIFGSGLRNGFANLTTVPAYSQINLGISHAFQSSQGAKPLTVSFNVVNLLDSIYVIRDGTGIGVFAPQYGPRRGFYLSLSQAL